MTRPLARPALTGAASITPADVARWRKNPVAWIEEWLVDPETPGQYYRLNRSQKRFLAKAFQLRPDGRPKYPELVYSAIKKSGKTAFAAMCALYVLLVLSPRFSEILIAANDFEQAQSRVFKQICRICEASPRIAGDALILRDRIEFVETRSTIIAIAGGAADSAGSNASLACFDELWGYVSEKSHRLWDECTPPPTRLRAWRLTTTYAGFSGESTLLETLHKRAMAGKSLGGELYEAPGMLCSWHTGPIAEWQTPEWIEQMRQQMRPNAFLRMICNQFVTSESTFIEEAWLDEVTDPNARPVLADRKLRVWGGVDASVRRDATAIVLCGWDDIEKKVFLVNHWIFTPTKADPIDFEQVVERTLLDIQRHYDVQRILYDPYQMQGSAQRLQRAGLPMREFPQTTDRLTTASQGLYDLFKAGAGAITLYPDPDIRLALMRCVAAESARGWKITKTQASHKVDVVIALAQACLGALQGGEEPEGGIICTPIIIDSPVRDRWSASNYYNNDLYGGGGGSSAAPSASDFFVPPKIGGGGW